MFNPASITFCNRLDLKLPILQAPMAGGIVTPELIAEVSKSGGLGSLPLGYLSLDEVQSAIRKTTALSPARFATNLFIPAFPKRVSQKQVAKLLKFINVYRERLRMPLCHTIPVWKEPSIDELLDQVIQENISIISITFGMLSQAAMLRLRQRNVFVMGTATTVKEGLALEEAGCHAVIAQGYEAGGHRGGDFLVTQPGGCVGTMALIPAMVHALNVPVIAAGGIMDGRGICAALALGASAVQLGTAFLTCYESGASPLHKHIVLESSENSTSLTSVFTGKPVRAFHNEFVNTIEKNFHNEQLLPYPAQHQLTKEIRVKANKAGIAEYAGLWGGQGSRLSRETSVADLMDSLKQETLAAISQFKLPY
jgi:nitronate monooxygenase